MEKALAPEFGSNQYQIEAVVQSPGRESTPGAVLALRPFELSSFKMKAFACLIDQFVLIIPSLFFSATMTLICFSSLSDLGLNTDFMRALCVGSGVASFFSAHWLYFTLCESSSKAATIGMSVLGIKVQKEEGTKLSFLEANNRYWLWVFSSVLFGMNFLGFLGKEKNLLHDKLCHTEVVREA
ncbi:MAG: putative RDD family membrane protein YckC [Bacteriovoracaceae bacterium]|jgi:uncharacterized RDD family membrane protein YckC